MIDDKIALELVDYWVAHGDRIGAVPNHLKKKGVTKEDGDDLLGPYKHLMHTIPSEGLRILRNDILVRLNERQRYEQYERWQKKNTEDTKNGLKIAFVSLIIAFAALCITAYTNNKQLDKVSKQIELMGNQTEIMDLQKGISEKQANISQELADIQKSREPHLILFVEPRTDYCALQGSNITTIPTGWLKTFSIYGDETITLTAVNGGDGPLNIIGLWAMYHCQNYKTNDMFSDYPILPSDISERVYIKEDENKTIFAQFESNVLLPGEKTSIRMIVPFNQDSERIRLLDNYACTLDISFSYSYENATFKEESRRLEIFWVNETSTDLMERYGCYQKTI